MQRLCKSKKRFSGGDFPREGRFFAYFFGIPLRPFYSNFTKVRFLILHGMPMIGHVKQIIKIRTWRNY